MIIAQLSDIHASPGNDNLARFERALNWLATIELDRLVMTGDLIDDNWFEGYHIMSSRLRGLGCPVSILPGNSDNRDSMRAGLRYGQWASTAPRGALNFVADSGTLRLIGLDSTLVGSSAGSIAEQLLWLDEVLSSAGSSGSILFMHHHVFRSGIPTMDEIMCSDSIRLADFLQNHPHKPLAIATGHVHRPMAGSLAGIPAYICGSICPANPLWFGSGVPPVLDPPTLMVHRFSGGSLVSHHVAV